MFGVLAALALLASAAVAYWSDAPVLYDRVPLAGVLTRLVSAGLLVTSIAMSAN